MEAQEEELGPIDIVVIGYPADAPMTGEAVPLLLDLVDRGIIRVLDVLFVMQGEDGTFAGFEADGRRRATASATCTSSQGASSGLLGDDDVATVADDDRARHRGRDDHVREPLGRAVRRRRPPQRRACSSTTSASRTPISSPPSTPPSRPPAERERT